MEARLPTWLDVDVPQSLINAIRGTGNSDLIAFLLNDRVFREENKITYNYICLDCGHAKNLRQFEDCSVCEKCGSDALRSKPYWKMGHDHYTKNGIDATKIIRKMENNFIEYSGVSDNIVTFLWEGKFCCRFLSGEHVKDNMPSTAIAKAAILTPFLWDTTFNWRDKIRNDRGNDLHFTHLISQWV